MSIHSTHICQNVWLPLNKLEKIQVNDNFFFLSLEFEKFISISLNEWVTFHLFQLLFGINFLRCTITQNNVKDFL
jgi:hypothetical protein